MSDTREARNLEKAKLKAQKSRDLRQEASLCNQLGEVLAKHGQFQEAIEEHRQELQLSEVLSDVIGCAVANRKIGECLAEIGNYTGALKHQRRHLELARSVDNDIEEQRALATIGRTYLYICETNQTSESLKEAENAFRKSLNIVDERLEGKVSRHELSEMRARLYFNLGFLYDNLKDPVKCSHYIRKSVFIAERNHLYEDLYRANSKLGSIHWRNGQDSKAVRCLEAAKECAKKMKEKFMESECFSNIGQVFLHLGDFVAAKRSLKKAFALGSREQSEHATVRKNLKNALKGCRLEEALSDLPEEEQEASLELCEQLGDLCCKLGCYSKAIDNYNMQLKHAESLCKADRELAVIHVSLAATFADLKDYGQSVEHYAAELSLRKGNPKEECETWLNMALAKEECGQVYGELEECYRNALRCAEQARLPRLQLRAMKLLHCVQQKMAHPEADLTLGQLEELSEALGSEREDGSETDELENSEVLEDSELELSESDDDGDIEGYEKLAPGRRKANRWNRRNEKGETVLHRACIEGNVKHVQCLVEKGHPLSPRDYCGWTPLHEACNHGHLEIVRLLLDHQVNVNDPGGPHCEGITPLHDAITCGNFDVAELLIQKGASVTVRNTKGETPLDSLYQWRTNYFKHLDQDTKQQCKHVERLLKSSSNRGELPVQDLRESDLFDSETSQPLELLELPVPPSSSRPVAAESRNYQRESGALCRSRQKSSTVPLTQGRVARGLAHSTADAPGIPLSSSPQTGARHRLDCSSFGEDESSEEDLAIERFQPVKKRHRVIGQRSPTTSGDAAPPDDAGSQEEVSEWPSPGTGQNADSDIPSVGTSAYRQAIRNLGSAKSRIVSKTLAETCHNAEPAAGKSALIPSSEYVEDSWLEDDLGSSRTRKRGREHSWLDIPTGPEESGHGSDTDLCPSSELRQSSERLALQKKRSRQMRMTQIVDRAVVGRTRNNKGSTKTVVNNSVPRTSEIIYTPLQPIAPSNSAVTVGPFTPPINSMMPPSIRVRVKVQDNTFLIPIPHSDSEVRTVSWLAEQATQRYYQMCGLRPKLSLKKEGALLSPQDPIIHVLQSNEEVLAEVQAWDLPPLVDRYTRACDSLRQAVNGLVLRACEAQESSTCFRLSNLSLNKEHLTPMLRALKLQTATRRLCLSANRLGDDAMDELLASLVTMPNLTLLDLSSNCITHEGLRKLCDPSTPSRDTPFQSLEELNLSLNPLGDGSSQLIASLIRSCPRLSTLKLQACGLTAKFLQHSRLLLSEAMKGAVYLKTLCLSHNALGSVGAELILQNLPHQTVTHLDLAAIGSTHGDTPLMEHLARYLSQDDCCLTHLNLSANRLTDDAVRDLSRCLLLCPSLVSLDVSANSGISTAGVELLLAAVRERSVGMQYLNVSGSSVHGPSDTAATGAKLRELRLCSSRLNKYDKESLLSSWRDQAACKLHTVSTLRKCLIRAVPSDHC